jgi:hypothetical protein
VRRWLASALFVVALAGCGETGGNRNQATATDEPSVAASQRIERCTERFLERVEDEDVSTEEARRYVEVTYCAPFVERGWVYEDGTLSIAAHTWLVGSSSEECVSARAGQPAQTVPCEEREPTGGLQVIDCALLHHVRRREVRDYVEELQREYEVECDDGTPVEELGASS